MLYTLNRPPASQPARITPSAVPNADVASAPVLQWVSTPCPSAGMSVLPCSPMRRLMASSSSWIRRASSSSRGRMLPGSGSASATRIIRRTAPAQIDGGGPGGGDVGPRPVAARR